MGGTTGSAGLSAERSAGSTLRRAGAHAVSLVLSQLLAAATLLALSIVLARGLGPERYGDYAIFIAMASVLSIPLSWLLGAVVVFGQEEMTNRGTASRAAGAIVLLALFGMVVVVLSAELAGPILSLAYPEPAALLDLAVAFVLASAITSVTLGTLQARAALHAYALVSLLTTTLPLAAAVIALAARGPNLRTVLLAYVLGQVAAALPFALALARRLPRPTVDRTQVSAVSRFAGAYLAGGIQGQLTGQADVLLVGILLDPVSIGHYGLATRLYRQLLSLTQVFGTIGLPLVNERRIRSRDGEVLTYVERRAPQILSFVAIGAALIATAGALAIPLLFGAGFQGAVGPLVALMLSVPAAVWRRLVSPVLTAYQLIWEANLAALVSAAVLVLALIAAVPVLAAVGAGLAVSIATLTDLLVALALVHRRLGGSTRLASIALLGAGTILVGLPAALAANLSLAALVFALAVCGYLLLVRALRVFGLRDLDELAPDPARDRIDAILRMTLRPFVRGSAGP